MWLIDTSRSFTSHYITLHTISGDCPASPCLVTTLCTVLPTTSVFILPMYIVGRSMTRRIGSEMRQKSRCGRRTRTVAVLQARNELLQFSPYRFVCWVWAVGSTD
jgi:hypothetical protein